MVLTEAWPSPKLRGIGAPGATVVEDPKWELAILATVQGFYEKLLQESVRGEVPVPSGLEAISLQSDDSVSETLSTMHRWLRLLDLAITPAMLRRAFTADTDPEIAEAMLRYFTRNQDASEVHRDKTDLITTFLYRHPRVPGQWERRGYGLDGSLPLPPFEIALLEILAEADTPSLTEEHVQIVRRFDQLQEEAEGFRDLNALLDSAIIPRVRELKQSLDASFYHPCVLATIAPYNTAFGRRFDALFHQAAAEIKSFAEVVEQQGGSILGNVDGVDVTVEHIAALEESELLRIDYGAALDKFRRVSKLKKTLDQRPPFRRSPRLIPAKPIVHQPAKIASFPKRRPVLDVQAMRSAVTPQQISGEESKLLRIEESIRVFVRVADPKFHQIVPMRFFNLMLTSAEADACGADYLEEKSIRAGVARVLLRLVAMVARMTTEMEELKRAEHSESLWKLHADSLVVLLEIGRSVNQNAERVMIMADERGAKVEADKIRPPLEKLLHGSQLAEKALAGVPAEKSLSATSAS
jgi:hypothetical protein